MSSIVPGFEYDIFISYRLKDNRSDQWVTNFVANLKEELDATIKDQVSIYFDENPHDGLHDHHDVDDSLKEKLKCLILIPIVSHTYCDTKSFAWKHEFKAFIELAEKDEFGLKTRLPGGNVASRILPVTIHDIDEEDAGIFEAAVGGYLRSIDFIYRDMGVNRPLSPDDNKDENFHKTRYRDQINKVANAIKDIIHSMAGSGVESVSTVPEFKFTEKIKRRNVVRTALVYILSALLVWKIVDVGIPLLKLDPNILKFTKLGLVIMFPIATLLAWLYERSPQGFIRTSSAAAAHNPLSDSQKKPLTSNTFIGLLTLTVIALFILFPNFSTSDSDPGSGYPDSVRTIAVMPFANISNDPEQEYFSDGISEELISALAKVENLKVAGRTSSFSFKGKNDDLKTIGKKLGVNTILDGSVRKFENTVRINAQLVNVSDGYQLWTDTYEMELDNIFTVQDEIVLSIMEELKVHLEPDLKQRIKTTETGSDAYDLYLQGRQKLAKRDDLYKAKELFEEVIELDPGYSPAYSGLARTLSVIPYWTLTSYQEIEDDLFTMANKALELDSLNAEAYSTLGTYYLNFKEWEQSEEYHERAVLLKPNDAEMLNFYGDYCRYVWHPDMLKYESKALELDRLYYNNHLEVGTSYSIMKDWSNTLFHAKNALRLDSTNIQAIYVITDALIQSNTLDEARKFLMKYPILNDEVEFALDLCNALMEAASGDVERSLQYISLSEEIVEEIGSYSTILALVYIKLNMPEVAAEWIENAYETNDHMINNLTLPEDYQDHPALKEAFDKPKLKKLYEIRRKNREIWG